MFNLHTCEIINHRAYNLQDPLLHFLAGIQLFMPAEYMVHLLPDTKAFGRVHGYICDPSLTYYAWFAVDPDKSVKYKPH